jgi:hypothetical protein
MNRHIASPIIARGLEITEKHLGMDELSRVLGVPDTTIRDWATGLTPMPVVKLLRLVELLHVVDPDWFQHVKAPATP